MGERETREMMRNTRKFPSYFACFASFRVFRVLFLLYLCIVLILAQVSPALADGGIVQMQQTSGPFLITVFTAPAPLRAGPAEISLMIQDSNNQQPVLNAEVILILSREEGMENIKVEARRAQAKNKLLYTALLNLPEAGRWKFEATVVSISEEARISGVMTVAPPRAFLLTYWWSLALPPICIGLFAINQWLKRRLMNGWKK